jgi:hypothetical protein
MYADDEILIRHGDIYELALSSEFTWQCTINMNISINNVTL